MLQRNQQSVQEKLLDFVLYLGTFAGINLIAGGIIHLLDYSIYNYFLIVIGMIVTPASIILREKWIDKQFVKKGIIGKFAITLILAVSIACITGGIAHLEDHTNYSLFLIISGLIMSIVTTLLYTEKSIGVAMLNFLLSIGIFSGMSLVSTTVVHIQNAWFSYWWLAIIGAILTPATIIIREKYIAHRKIENPIMKFAILFMISFGVGAFGGGIIHINVNTLYSIGLIVIGLIVGISAALLNKGGSLADLKNI
jgi:hypothetical protein